MIQQIILGACIGFGFSACVAWMIERIRVKKAEVSAARAKLEADKAKIEEIRANAEKEASGMSTSERLDRILGLIEKLK